MVDIASKALESKLDEVDLDDTESLKQTYHELLSKSYILSKAYKNLQKEFKKLSKDHTKLNELHQSKDIDSFI